MPRRWIPADIPDQTGRVAVITGGASGIGRHVAAALARRGATIVLTARDPKAATCVAAEIGGAVSVQTLDLASLRSIATAADEIRARFDRIDLLINSAGVMWVPRGATVDGFERHIGINHLGHFALTASLLDRLRATPGARIVTVSSIAHRQAALDPDDLMATRAYHRHEVYGGSKLANLLFTFALQRRLAATGSPAIAVAAHPGITRTALYRHAHGPLRLATTAMLWTAGQPAARGAEPILRAATDPAVTGGEYYGPSGLLEMRGRATLAGTSAAARDTDLQERLWRASERLTGIMFPT